MAEHFTYRVSWSEEDGEHVGTCLEFPSLSHLADDPEAALRGVRKLVADVVADLRANNQPIPQPLADTRLFRQVHDPHPIRAAPPVGARSCTGTDQLKSTGQHAVVSSTVTARAEPGTPTDGATQRSPSTGFLW